MRAVFICIMLGPSSGLGHGFVGAIAGVSEVDVHHLLLQTQLLAAALEFGRLFAGRIL